MVVHSETDNGYFESLDWQGKRYKEKLETVGLSLQDDPYERFSSGNDKLAEDRVYIYQS